MRPRVACSRLAVAGGREKRHFPPAHRNHGSSICFEIRCRLMPTYVTVGILATGGLFHAVGNSMCHYPQRMSVIRDRTTDGFRLSHLMKPFLRYPRERCINSGILYARCKVGCTFFDSPGISCFSTNGCFRMPTFWELLIEGSCFSTICS